VKGKASSSLHCASQVRLLSISISWALLMVPLAAENLAIVYYARDGRT
jgi:hypothetical protein